MSSAGLLESAIVPLDLYLCHCMHQGHLQAAMARVSLVEHALQHPVVPAEDAVDSLC